MPCVAAREGRMERHGADCVRPGSGEGPGAAEAAAEPWPAAWAGAAEPVNSSLQLSWRGSKAVSYGARSPPAVS